MYSNMLRDKFNESKTKAGLSSVAMVAICSSLGYPVTRATLSELVKASLVEKPEAINDAAGNGKRLAFSYTALVDLLIYLIIAESLSGLTKGSPLVKKDRIFKAAYKIAKNAGYKVVDIISSAQVPALVEASTLVPFGSTPSAYDVRRIIIRIAILKAFLHNWFSAEYHDILRDRSVVKDRCFSQAYKLPIKLEKLLESQDKSNANGDKMEKFSNALQDISKTDTDTVEAARTWLEMVLYLENGSGLVSAEANAFAVRHYGRELFSISGEDLWLLAVSICT